MEKRAMRRLLLKISEKESENEKMPERIKVVEFKPEKSRKIRRMNVDNYSVFFFIYGEEVFVTNVLYSASDISNRLK